MINLKTNGGRLVKDFDPYSTDTFVQCIADIGARSVSFTPISDEEINVVIDGVKLCSNSSAEIKLREDTYGYVCANVEITSTDGTYFKSFTLAVLKPAPSLTELYSAEYRPRFHYTAPYGYINDPNGLVYDAARGVYHLFYQSNPYAPVSGPKHWGHAVTRDLVTFTEYPTALYPDNSGAMWSGTAIIDRDNTAKLYSEDTSPDERILLVYYACADGVNAGLAYTPDGGKSWIKAESGRKFVFHGVWPGHIDPKIIWFEKANKWVMFCATGDIFTSTDLWSWYLAGKTQDSECPDIYEIAVEDTDEKKYVFTYGGSDYRVGVLRECGDGSVEFVPETPFLPFNGGSFTPREQSTKDLLKEYGWYSGQTGNLYATQHYNAAPNDRIVSASWLIERGLDKTGTWAGALSVAVEHTLRRKRDGGYMLCSYPVKEFEALRDELVFSAKDTVISPESENILKDVNANYADIDAVFVLDERVTEVGLRLRTGANGDYIAVKYDATHKLLTTDLSASGHESYNGARTMEMELPESRRLSLRVLLDSIIVESFGNNGEAYISSVFCREDGGSGIELYTAGGSTRVEKLDVYTVKSIWDCVGHKV